MVAILNTQWGLSQVQGRMGEGMRSGNNCPAYGTRASPSRGFWPRLADLPSRLLTWPQVGLLLEGSCDQSHRPPRPFPAHQHRLH